MTKKEAAWRLGVSEDTIERRLRQGKLNGQQEPTPQGFRWLIELPEEKDLRNDSASDPLETPVDAPPNEVLSLRELVATLQMQVTTQQEQLTAKDHQFEAREREIQELHVLLQQAQEQLGRMLPAPRQRRWWWPFP